MPASLSTEKAKGSLLARMAGQFGAFETLRDADASIHAAKIHLNKAVKRKNGIHVTGLADHIGITVGRFASLGLAGEKGLIGKTPASVNLPRLRPSLTVKGDARIC